MSDEFCYKKRNSIFVTFTKLNCSDVKSKYPGQTSKFDDFESKVVFLSAQKCLSSDILVSGRQISAHSMSVIAFYKIWKFSKKSWNQKKNEKKINFDKSLQYYSLYIMIFFLISNAHYVFVVQCILFMRSYFQNFLDKYLLEKYCIMLS